VVLTSMDAATARSMTVVAALIGESLIGNP